MALSRARPSRARSARRRRCRHRLRRHRTSRWPRNWPLTFPAAVCGPPTPVRRRWPWRRPIWPGCAPSARDRCSPSPWCRDRGSARCPPMCGVRSIWSSPIRPTSQRRNGAIFPATCGVSPTALWWREPVPTAPPGWPMWRRYWRRHGPGWRVRRGGHRDGAGTRRTPASRHGPFTGVRRRARGAGPGAASAGPGRPHPMSGPRVVAPRQLGEVLDALAAGRAVAVPGDGGYQLAVSNADVGCPRALACPTALLQAMRTGRSWWVAGQQAAALSAPWNKQTSHLADRMWPGPLTLILPARRRCARVAGPGDSVVRITMPAWRPLRTLVRRSGPSRCSTSSVPTERHSCTPRKCRPA